MEPLLRKMRALEPFGSASTDRKIPATEQTRSLADSAGMRKLVPLPEKLRALHEFSIQGKSNTTSPKP